MNRFVKILGIEYDAWILIVLWIAIMYALYKTFIDCKCNERFSNECKVSLVLNNDQSHDIECSPYGESTVGDSGHTLLVKSIDPNGNEEVIVTIRDNKDNDREITLFNKSKLTTQELLDSGLLNDNEVFSGSEYSSDPASLVSMGQINLFKCVNITVP